MTDWIICDVCECRYAPIIMTNGKPSKEIACPALNIHKTSLNHCGEIWRERVLKHRPEWEEQYQPT